MIELQSLLDNAPRRPGRATGRLIGIRSGALVAELPYAALGELCRLHLGNGAAITAQVIGFHGSNVLLAPFDELRGLAPGVAVEHLGAAPSVSVSQTTLGRVLNCFGDPIDGGTNEIDQSDQLLYRSPPSPLNRTPIHQQITTGIRAIDAVMPIGFGQRVGLFAGPAVGKSTLLGMIARRSTADVCVIGLIGERGREVGEFLTDALGPEGRKRSVVVVATSDEPAIRRVLAAHAATAIAEYFRGQGKNVLLLVDSLTRMARALREVGLAAGELPIRHGFTASVYAELPRLLERAGTDSRGSITAIYTVLTDGDGSADPLAGEVRSLLDGHITLSTPLAERGVRPAIDLTHSVSRLADRFMSPADQHNARTVRRAAARLHRDKDLALLGGRPDPELASAIRLEPEIERFLTQAVGEVSTIEHGRAWVGRIAEELGTGR